MYNYLVIFILLEPAVKLIHDGTELKVEPFCVTRIEENVFVFYGDISQ